MIDDRLPSTPSQRHLLLVDDEESILLALRRMLRRDGYVIHIASSGPEGLQLIEREPIGVIVSDQRMPLMSGTEFLARVKDRHPETIRIVLSGYTELSSITEAINKGAIYKFLTKPWDDELLRQHIADAFAVYEMKRENLRLAALNQAVVDAIPDALLLVDPVSARIVAGNRAAATMLGYDIRALEGMPIAKIEPLPGDLCYWDEVATGGFRTAAGVETEYLTSSGDFIPVRKTITDASDGTTRRALVLAHNLAMERATESALLELNAELASVLEASAEALLVLDPQLGLKRVNHRLTAMFPLSPDALESNEGGAVLEAIAEQTTTPQQTLAAFRCYLDRPGEHAAGNLRCCTGTRVRWYASPQLHEGLAIGYVFAFIDDGGAPARSETPGS